MERLEYKLPKARGEMPAWLAVVGFAVFCAMMYGLLWLWAPLIAAALRAGGAR